MLKILARAGAVALLCAGALPLQAAPAADSDSTLAAQERRELGLARLAMTRQRPDIACAVLEPTTASDSHDGARLSILARCSAALGRREAALGYYRRAIAAQPGVAALRAELAGLYLTLGRAEEAAQAFDEAARYNRDAAGNALMHNLAERLRAGDPARLAQTMTKPWSVQLYAGLTHDDNVNAGPVSRNVPALLGGVPITFELASQAMPRASWGATTDLNGSYAISLDARSGVLLQAGYVGTAYFSEPDFSNDTVSAAAAYIHRTENGLTLSAQSNLRYTRLHGELQEVVPGAALRAEQRLNETWSLTGSAGYFHRDMRTDPGRDADGWHGSAGVIGQLTADVTLGAEYQWQRENADDDVQSRRLRGPNLYAAVRLRRDFSLIGNYSRSDITYDQRMALFAHPRDDEQKIAALTALWDVSRWAGCNLVARAQYVHIDNPSNVAYNRFRRELFSFGLQTQF